MSAKHISFEAWQAELARHEGNRERRPSGPGWIERDKLERRLNIGRVKFHKFMAAGRRAGTIEYFEGNVRKNNRLVRRSWYRLKPAR
jgi:hypothetical protein